MWKCQLQNANSKTFKICFVKRVSLNCFLSYIFGFNTKEHVIFLQFTRFRVGMFLDQFKKELKWPHTAASTTAAVLQMSSVELQCRFKGFLCIPKGNPKSHWAHWSPTLLLWYLPYHLYQIAREEIRYCYNCTNVVFLVIYCGMQVYCACANPQNQTHFKY